MAPFSSKLNNALVAFFAPLGMSAFVAPPGMYASFAPFLFFSSFVAAFLVLPSFFVSAATFLFFAPAPPALAPPLALAPSSFPLPLPSSAAVSSSSFSLAAFRASASAFCLSFCCHHCKMTGILRFCGRHPVLRFLGSNICGDDACLRVLILL